MAWSAHYLDEVVSSTLAHVAGASPMSLDEHQIDFRVRYAETDQMGFVHHANYLVYFEMGRVEMLRARGFDYQEMEDKGVLLVIVKMEVKYRRPAKYDDLLTLSTRLEKISRVRVDHSYQLCRGQEVLTEAQSTLASVDRQGRPCGLPEDFVEAIAHKS